MADQSWLLNTTGKTLVTLAADTEIRVIDDPAGTPTSKKTTVGALATFALGVALATANTWTATQTITPAANTSALTVTGYSLTGSNAQPLIDLAGTWNTSGTPTALKLNVTDTASNASSLLMDLQIGGSSKINVDKSGNITCAGYIVAGTQILLTYGSTSFRVNLAGTKLGSLTVLGWAQSSDSNDTLDTILIRDAANTLAMRNSTNAQTFRAYFSYTDASNYTRLALKTATTIHTIETESAGTGEADIDLALVPKGTGRVRYGTHSAIAAETITGYITVKDSGGTERKLAVVS